jgi:sulfite reductase (ferredoxin)
LTSCYFIEAKDKLTLQRSFEDKKWADAIYHAYAGFVNGAKALLIETRNKPSRES